jgi:hypothetical protein
MPQNFHARWAGRFFGTAATIIARIKKDPAVQRDQKMEV